MSVEQITTNCHIIPIWYIKNFSDEWKIFYANKNNLWNIKESDKKYLFAAKNNVYNYSNDISPIINEFENHFNKKETKASGISKKLITEINMWIKNWWFTFKKERKENTIRIFLLLFEKILYYNARNVLSINGSQIIKEDDLIGIFWHLNWTIPHFNCIFHILTTSDFYWSILYSKNGIFYFWDIPFHVNTCWGNIQREDFFKNYWSSILFPLSKNIIIGIEHIKKNKKYMPFYDIDNIKQNTWLIKEIMERISINCDEYIACSDKKTLESLIKRKKYIKNYQPDVYHNVLKTTLVQEIISIKNTISRYKAANRLFAKIGLKDMKDEFVSRYYIIDKEFSKPLKVEKYIEIITWWNKDKIRKTLKEKKYIEIFRNSKTNLAAINNYFKV